MKKAFKANMMIDTVAATMQLDWFLSRLMHFVSTSLPVKFVWKNRKGNEMVENKPILQPRLASSEVERSLRKIISSGDPSWNSVKGCQELFMPVSI